MGLNFCAKRKKSRSRNTKNAWWVSPHDLSPLLTLLLFCPTLWLSQKSRSWAWVISQVVAFPHHRRRTLSSCSCLPSVITITFMTFVIWLFFYFHLDFLPVSAVRAALCSEAWIYGDARGQLYRNCCRGDMVQDSRPGEDPDSVHPAPAQSPAGDSCSNGSSVATSVVLLSNGTVLTTKILISAFLNAHTASLGAGVQTGLQYEDEGNARPGKARAATPQQASQTVRTLCSLTSDPQLVRLHSSAFKCLSS